MKRIAMNLGIIAGLVLVGSNSAFAQAHARSHHRAAHRTYRYATNHTPTVVKPKVTTSYNVNPWAWLVAPSSTVVVTGTSTDAGTFDAADANNDGSISYREWLNATASATGFTSVDRDHNGRISFAEWSAYSPN